MMPPKRTEPDHLDGGSGTDEYATQRTTRDGSAGVSQSTGSLDRCVGSVPCVEVEARLSASVDAWLAGCDDAAVGLVQQAANYARLHELAPLPDDGEVPS
jgi:hypothetical protein